MLQSIQSLLMPEREETLGFPKEISHATQYGS
jgi:hypothetical protein